MQIEQPDIMRSDLFSKARSHIKSSQMLRVISFLCAQRKFVILLGMHVALTSIVWVHYSFAKYQMIEMKEDYMLDGGDEAFIHLQ